MDYQLNFKSSSLFKVNKMVHPATIISVFCGYPLLPQGKDELINLLNFLLGIDLPHDYLTAEVIKNQCQKVSPYLKNHFSNLSFFCYKHSAEIGLFSDPYSANSTREYQLAFLEKIESTFGTKIGVIKMDPSHLRQNDSKQQKAEEIHPLDTMLNAHRPAQIFRLPKFLPPFYLHKDQAQMPELNVENNGVPKIPVAKL